MKKQHMLWNLWLVVACSVGGVACGDDDVNTDVQFADCSIEGNDGDTCGVNSFCDGSVCAEYTGTACTAPGAVSGARCADNRVCDGDKCIKDTSDELGPCDGKAAGASCVLAGGVEGVCRNGTCESGTPTNLCEDAEDGTPCTLDGGEVGACEGGTCSPLPALDVDACEELDDGEPCSLEDSSPGVCVDAKCTQIPIEPCQSKEDIAEECATGAIETGVCVGVGVCIDLLEIPEDYCAEQADGTVCAVAMHCRHEQCVPIACVESEECGDMICVDNKCTNDCDFADQICNGVYVLECDTETAKLNIVETCVGAMRCKHLPTDTYYVAECIEVCDETEAGQEITICRPGNDGSNAMRFSGTCELHQSVPIDGGSIDATDEFYGFGALWETGACPTVQCHPEDREKCMPTGICEDSDEIGKACYDDWICTDVSELSCTQKQEGINSKEDCLTCGDEWYCQFCEGDYAVTLYWRDSTPAGFAGCWKERGFECPNCVAVDTYFECDDE